MMSKRKFKKKINEYVINDLYEWYKELAETHYNVVLFMKKDKDKNMAELVVVPEKYSSENTKC